MNDEKKIRILCMEDDPGLARLLERSLRRYGFHPDFVSDGESGIRMHGDDPYDLLVIDYRMPEMNGLEVIEHLKEKGEMPPVIMITGEGNEEVAVQAMKLGVSDYMVKDAGARYLRLIPFVIRQALENFRIKKEKQSVEAGREELLRDLDAFSYTVAHDLKTPVNSLKGILHVLRTYYADEEAEKNRLLETMDVTIAKMGNIIDELLLLAMIRKGEVRLNTLDMEEVVRRACDSLDYLVRKYEAVVEFETPFPDALGHQGWIEEVWTNYISNAIKYGGKPPVVQLGAEQLPGKGVRYWVRDNGNGIPEDQLTDIFQPFTRLEEVRAEGHGLGLSIVKKIMDKLGGEVGIVCTNGGGCEFSFTLPDLQHEKNPVPFKTLS